MEEMDSLRAVREVRERISAEFENDPEKLVAYYIEQQKRHSTRLLAEVSPRQSDPADGPSANR